MELNLEKKQQLEKLLVKPSLATQEHIPFLQQLIETYPYYQPLYLLLAKASSRTESKDQAFTKAALYTSGSMLHRVIHEQHLDAIKDINVVTYESWADNNYAEMAANEQVFSEAETPLNAAFNLEETSEIENLAPLTNEIMWVEDTEEDEISQEEVLPTILPTFHQDFILPEIENLEPLQSEILKVCEPEQIIQETPEADEQEVFEEINEFIAPPEIILKEEVEVASIEIEEETATVHEEKAEEQIQVQSPAEEIEEELVIDAIAATDFFAFDRSFSTETITAQEITETIVTEDHTAAKVEIDLSPEHIVSKYDDDQLPFTFLWWLAKTRKDHEQIFRPFASPVTANAQPLEQQYIEHIFHIQAPLAPVEHEQEATSLTATKENSIIENFIKNDPQIKALKPDQINNENKAKRSAEDSNDVVSETLAQIYIEQMLYHKAIDTYQKLSLKFPEKSGYFADLIQSLEKKI